MKWTPLTAENENNTTKLPVKEDQHHSTKVKTNKSWYMEICLFIMYGNTNVNSIYISKYKCMFQPFYTDISQNTNYDNTIAHNKKFRVA